MICSAAWYSALSTKIVSKHLQVVGRSEYCTSRLRLYERETYFRQCMTVEKRASCISLNISYCRSSNPSCCSARSSISAVGYEY